MGVPTQFPWKRGRAEPTCHQVAVMELAHSISFEPGNLVPEKSIKHWEALLGQRPVVAEVGLR